ncbi:hypothetical protein [Kineococcus terrestris]|uniref:hypothetical protein n=1 Tax=Kineococcus terrestris TaxID=2044856 RepID=UPI0034DB48F7
MSTTGAGTTTSSRARTDGFGTGAARWWRRLAGAGVVAVLALAFAALGQATSLDGTDRDAGFWALLVVACTYAGVLLSRLVSGSAHDAGLVGRHAAAGAGLGLVAAVLLDVAFYSEDVGWLWPLLVPVGLAAGTLVGTGTAVLALVVPHRAAPAVALLGVAAVAALVWLTFRPAAPFDLVALDDTPEVATAGGATGLAEATREAVERAGADGDLRTGEWALVLSDDVTSGMGGSRPHGRATPVEDLPLSRETGQPVRLITVRVRGAESACVVVEADATSVLDGACEDLDLVR